MTISDMDPAFIKALSPRDHYALRFKLEPLTVGHRLLLRKHGSAFVTGDDPRLEDLMLSVFICCQPWRKAERGLKAWWFSMFIWLWSHTLRWCNPAEEAQKFSDYLEDSHAMAKVVAEGNGEEMQTPLDLRFLTMLTTDFGQRYQDALDVPIVMANALAVCHGERKGLIKLYHNSRIASLLAYARQRDLEKFGGN